MAPDSDTRPNFIKWYKVFFGFSNQVATALYDNQLFQDAANIAEFSNSEIDSVCVLSVLAASDIVLTFWWESQREVI